jgi:hypothetical protein
VADHSSAERTDVVPTAAATADVRSPGSNMPACIVCQTPNAPCQLGVPARGGSNFFRCDCPRSGSFALAEDALLELERLLGEVPLRRSVMSHTLRRMQRPDNSHFHIITNDELPTFCNLSSRQPTPLEQVDNLILWIGKNQAAPSEADVDRPALGLGYDYRGERRAKFRCSAWRTR